MEAKRVLVVTSERGWFKYYSVVLKDLNLDLVMAPSAELAFAFLIREPFDLILSDSVLPGADGFAFLRKLSAQSSYPPFIFFFEKDWESTDEDRKLLKEKAFDVLSKEDIEAKLPSLVKKALKKKK